MKRVTLPSVCTTIVILATLILPARAALILNGDFETFSASSPPPGSSGYFTETTGAITDVSSTITDTPSLVIADSKSWLFTFSADDNVFDNEVGGYYTAV
ncbi:MAG: hypothetical protein SNJ52_02785, partial [Verrucomicrobiia bacterium]